MWVTRSEMWEIDREILRNAFNFRFTHKYIIEDERKITFMKILVDAMGGDNAP